jgi:hypothetical protein
MEKETKVLAVAEFLVCEKCRAVKKKAGELFLRPGNLCYAQIPFRFTSIKANGKRNKGISCSRISCVREM